MGKTLSSLDAFIQEAGDFTRTLTATDRATLVTLRGELGAGKTTFVQAVANVLGVTKRLTSPTFVLEKIYALPAPFNGFTHLVHIDAYRLHSGSELEALGFTECIKDPHTLIVLEWPEKVAEVLPRADVAITIDVVDENTRIVSYI